MQTLAVKYRPKTWNDVTEQDAIKIILRQQLATNTIKHAYLFCGGAGTGKAQPLYSKILTPDGYINMGDIHVGDKVFTRKGNIASISGVFPQGKKPIYEITLQDRTKIRVAEDHLNNVYIYNTHRKQREDYVLSTLDLINFLKNTPYKVRMDIPSVNWEKRDVLIDPYLLGVLIGDGSLNNNFSFSNSEQDIVDKVNNILDENYNMKLVPISGFDYHIQYNVNPGHNGSKGDHGKHSLVFNYDPLTTLKGQLDHYGLLCKSIDKHIPLEYLLNDEGIRIRLLQGLFDTDGYTEKQGSTSFSTSSPKLSEDFAFLVRSLGIRDTICESQSSYKDSFGNRINCSICYNHYLHIPKDFDYCTSKKHLSRYKNRQNPPIRNIVSIEYVGEEDCQCIMVDDEDHTYISDDFIPTHNTTCARIFANEINKGHGNPIEMDAASNSGVEDVRNISQQAKTKSLDSEYKIFIIDECHAISNTGWQAFLKLIEEPPAKSIFIFCTTDPQKIPKTILSRVQRYDFKRISQQGIESRLNHILDEEGYNSYRKEALEYITRIADGGMRDAISLMDKALSFNTELTLKNVVKALGTVDYQVMMDLTDAVITSDGKAAMKVVEQVHSDGKDVKQFVNQYVQFLMDIQKFGLSLSFKYLQMPETEENTEWLESLENEDFDVCYTLLEKMLKLNADIKWSQTAKYDLEAVLLLLCLENKK